MGSYLGKLVNLHTLNLERTRCGVWIVLVAVIGVEVFIWLWDACVGGREFHRCRRSCGNGPTSGVAGEHAYAQPCLYAMRYAALGVFDDLFEFTLKACVHCAR